MVTMETNEAMVTMETIIVAAEVADKGSQGEML